MKTDGIRVTEDFPEAELHGLIFIPEGETNCRVAAWINKSWMTPGMKLICANQATHWRPLAPQKTMSAIIDALTYPPHGQAATQTTAVFPIRHKKNGRSLCSPRRLSGGSLPHVTT